MNVFSGPSAILDFHDPSKNLPLPLVEIPQHPFAHKGVRIYAKMLTMLPSTNVKALTARNMMEHAIENGDYDPCNDKIVEYSSGNTVTSLAILNGIRGGPQAEAYVSNKTSREKMNMLRFFNLELTLFGGPTQVEPADVWGGVAAAIRKGKEPGYWCPGQYTDNSNVDTHIRWTGPQIASQLPSISVFCAAVGTSGTMAGTGAYLRERFPSIVNVGAFTAPGEHVPGPRPIDLVSTIDFPWREVVEIYEHVSGVDAYRTSLELSRRGILVGPSSGLTLAALYQYLSKLDDAGFDSLRGEDGMVTCVFICCDLPFLYINDYFKKLPPSLFPTINESDLMHVDQYIYPTDARLSASKAHMLLKCPSLREVVIVDLQHADAFARSHIDTSFAPKHSIEVVNLPVDDDPISPTNPFMNGSALIQQYKMLEQLLGGETLPFRLAERNVIFVCTGGTISSTACAIVRARHGSITKAWYIEDGMVGWKEKGMPLFEME
ncbi:tryptophan synthase beta subunit-like PLP-dependent enzyme [Flagelloscypha sp. PMI_526]|nr:tryptophan synthase beta subunit-like PLP-dependent enzyme [Flagelloscypha sp. PMI_526]